MIQTRKISVRLYEPDGRYIANAPVRIKLLEVGIGPSASVSPATITKTTNAGGFCVFDLWQGGKYEITSTHPVSKKTIHNRLVFTVPAYDADVSALVPSKTPVPAVSADPAAYLDVTIPQGVNSIIELGPEYDADGNAFLYRAGNRALCDIVYGRCVRLVNMPTAGAIIDLHFTAWSQIPANSRAIVLTVRVVAPGQEHVLPLFDVSANDSTLPFAVSLTAYSWL